MIALLAWLLGSGVVFANSSTAMGRGLAGRHGQHRPQTSHKATGKSTFSKWVLPPQGIYESCSAPESVCAARLKTMRQMGFQLVMNYAEPDDRIADAVAYADDAAHAHLQVIWNFANLWEEEGSAPDKTQKLAVLMAVLRKLPATWGYYIGDEVAPVDLEPVRVAAQSIHRLDPAHPLLQVTCGMCTLGTPSQLLAPFGGVADYLGEDTYPEVSQSQTPSSLEAAVAARAQESLETARVSHTHPIVVLQAWNWSEDTSLGVPPTQFPTVTQMVAMARGALTKHSALMLWFSFFGWVSNDAT
jgi:hypothetical protein